MILTHRTILCKYEIYIYVSKPGQLDDLRAQVEVYSFFSNMESIARVAVKFCLSSRSKNFKTCSKAFPYSFIVFLSQ